ncbi:hypothetical protein KEM54_001431 [Ascosphaera aggregata]|nr:hypothetical protein KEM54_001431 [Ascosphaera aggregata]
MKQRFSSLDVRVISRELSSSIVGLRIANIYDLSSRICLFKLQLPDVRKQLVVDPGFRCHLTDYTRTTADAPSPFIARLRKFIKTRRVTKISQVGTDRIIHFELSDGQFHLFFEFFAAGNIILTDSDYNVVVLLRTVADGSGQEPLRVGLRYDVENKQNYKGTPPVSVERLRAALQNAAATQAETANDDKQQQRQQQKKKNNKKSKKVDELRRALSAEFPEFPPLLLDHAFAVSAFDSSLTPEQMNNDQSLFSQLMQVLNEARDVTEQLSSAVESPGYIISKKNAEAAPGKDFFDDFHPFIPKQFETNELFTIQSYPTFSKAVDVYFSTVETQKLESRLGEREAAARRKLETARKDHEQRLNALQELQQLQIRKAQAIELNFSRVEEVINSVGGLIAQGMDWVEIARLIEMEQSRQNPIAKTIKLPLKLYENTVTIVLQDSIQEEKSEESDSESESDDDDDDDDDEKRTESQGSGSRQRTSPEYLTIDIDLGLSPWANARQYYDQKKYAADKEEKTLKASKKALESHEKKVAADLKRGLKQEKPVLRLTRTPFWFEKFLFFVSSDGYLILGGKDAQQFELLYLYYLNKGDVYVHADVDKAVPMVIKNNPNTPNAPIPPSTLNQAGIFSVASSKAWDTKALMGAWWVKAEQVSRTTPEGEYLTSGGVFVSGTKNPLPPAQLVLGFAVMFQISEESVRNHRKLRDGGPAQDLEGIPEVGKDELLDEHHDETQCLYSSQSSAETEDVGASRGVTESSQFEDSISAMELKGTPIPSDDGHDSDVLDGDDTTHGVEQLDKEPLDKSDDLNAQVSDSGDRSHVSGGPGANAKSITTSAKSIQHVRGKRGKKKKIAEKYKYQDEEDRALALRLLGSAVHKDATSSSSAGKSKSAPAKTKEQKEAEIEAQKARRRAQHEKAARAERERLQRLHNEEGSKAERVETADMSMLPCLVGFPKAGDEVLGAFPICAPWTALATFKYKTKIQPGPLKRGKAVKEMITRWVVGAEAAVKAANRGTKEGVDDETSPQANADEVDEKSLATAEAGLAAQEFEILKAWKDTEGVNSVPVSSMRIVFGAGDKGSKGKGRGGGAAKKEKTPKGGKNAKGNKK